MRNPLSRFAPSPWEGDDALAAGRRGRRRPLLGVPDVGPRRFHVMCLARSAEESKDA
jgi:hypothetical protein